MRISNAQTLLICLIVRIFIVVVVVDDIAFAEL